MTDELILAASGTTMDDREYLRRVYGGLLGKCAGVRLGGTD